MLLALIANNLEIRNRGELEMLQNRPGAGVNNILLRKGSPLSVSLGTPPHTPTRFTLLAARGKTSLNARDW